MIKYKIDVMKELRKRGYDTKKIKETGLLSQGTITNIKKGGHINTETLNRLCLVLRLKPSDIIDIIPTDEEKIKYFWFLGIANH